uniref:Uncharacterized protein n=1 Tax=Glossina palpalis gambiensis TaxID=67801 RepID=A0A1B0BT49_9MUSC
MWWRVIYHPYSIVLDAVASRSEIADLVVDVAVPRSDNMKISLENFHNFINNFCLPLLARTVVIENVAHEGFEDTAGTVELFIPPIIPPAGVCVEFDWPNVDDVDAEALALLIIRSPRSLIKSHIPLHFSEIAASVWKDPTVAYCESKSLAEMLTTVSEGNIIKFGTDLISSGAFLLDLMHDGNSRATSKPCENVRKTPSYMLPDLKRI